MTTDVLVKMLAVIGSGAGGGLGLGLLAQLLLRTMTARKPPRWSMQTVRLLGAVICAWFVALWLFGGGGPGIGGTGGWGLGAGAGNGDGEKAVETGMKDRDVKKKNGGETKTPAGPRLQIEVLGNATLTTQDIQQERRYRLDMDRGPLLTFEEVKAAVGKRQQEQPALRSLEIILYKDSPAEDNLFVSQLETWAKELNGGKLFVKTSKSNTDAPKR